MQKYIFLGLLVLSSSTIFSANTETVTNGFNDGAGSLRAAIGNVSNDGTIEYSSSLTTKLTSALPINSINLEQITNNQTNTVFIEGSGIILKQADVPFVGITVNSDITCQDTSTLSINAKNVQTMVSGVPTLNMTGAISIDATSALNILGTGNETINIGSINLQSGSFALEQSQGATSEVIVHITDSLFSEDSSQTTLNANTKLVIDTGSDAGLGSVSGQGSLIKNKNSILSILGPATYSGTTEINAGTLTIAGSGFTCPSDFSGSSGVLNLGSTNSQTPSNGQIYTGTFTGSYAINVNANSTSEELGAQIKGTLQTTGDITVNGSLIIDGFVPGLESNIILNSGSFLEIGPLFALPGGSVYNGSISTSTQDSVNVLAVGDTNTIINGEFDLNNASKLTVNSGTLTLSNIKDNFGADISISAGVPSATLELTNTSNRTINSDISGTGKFINNSTGATTTLTGSLNIGNGILNSSGHLVITEDINNVSIQVTDGSVTAGNASSLSTSKEIDIQNGSFIKQGTGSLSLSGSLNSHIFDSSITTNNPSIQVQQGSLAIETSDYDYSGSLDVSSQASLTLGNNPTSGTREYQNAITGEGSLVIDVTSGSSIEFSSNDISLSGGVSFTPITTPITPASVSFSGNFTNFSSAIALPATYKLVANPTGTQTFSGDISGGGNILKQGSGTSTFSGNLSGVSFLNSNGTLSLQGQSVSSNVEMLEATLEIGSNATTIQTISGTIEDSLLVLSPSSSYLNKVGAGTTNITSNISGFTGNINVQKGTLQVSDPIVGALNISQGATLEFLGISSTTTSSVGTVSGDGTLAVGVSSSEAIRLSNPTLDIKALDVKSGGVIFIGAVNGNEDLDISIAAGSFLTFNPSAAQTFVFSDITGAGDVNILSGDVTLEGNAAYTGNTQISGGSLAFVGNIDDLKGSIDIDSGTLSFNPGENLTQTFTGDISGSGGVNQNSLGLTTLKGNLSYSGLTTVSQGTLFFDTSMSDLSGDIEVKDNALLQLGAFNIPGYSGDISGQGDVSVLGDVALSGTLSYSGTTTVQSGTLFISSVPETSFNGEVILKSNAFFNDSINSNHTLSNAFSGEGGLVLGGSGITTLNGPLTFTGSLSVNSGTLALTGVLPNFEAEISLGTAATLNVGAASSILQNLSSTIIGGTGSILKTGANRTTLSGDIVLLGQTTVAEGVLSLQGIYDELIGPIDIQDGAILELGSSLIPSTALNADISGDGGLSKIGSSVATLNSTLSYTGTTSVAEGILSIAGQASALTGEMEISDGATLQFGRTSDQTIGANVSGLGILSKSSSGTTTFSGALTNEGVTSIFDGTLELTGDVSNWVSELFINLGGVLQDSISSNHTLSNAITGGGDFTKTTNSALTLSGDLSYVGTTTILGGSITLPQVLANFKSSFSLNNDSNLIVGSKSGDQNIEGNIEGFGSVIKNNKGTTIINGDHSFSQNLTINAGTLGFLSPITQFAGSITISSGAKFTIGADGSQTLTSDVAGGGTLDKINSGRSEISGTYTHSGTINIEEGILAIDGLSTTLSGPINISKDAFFEFGSPGSHTLTNVIRGEGGFIDAASGTTTLSGGYSFTGDTQVKSGALVLDGKIKNYPGNVTLASNTSLKLGSASDQKLTGNILGGGSVTKAGSGALTLSGDLSYTGDTIFSAGEMTLNGPITDLPSNIQISDGLVLNLSSNLALREQQIFSGQIQGLGGVKIDGLAEFKGDVSYQGDTAIATGSILGIAGDFSSLTGDVTISKNAGLAIKNSQNKILNLNIFGKGDLVKDGIGDLIIDKPLNLTGDIIVTGGNLVVNTTIGKQTVVVEKGGALKGTGTVEFLVNDGVVAPGESIGTLSVSGNYVQGPSGVLENEFNETQTDLLQVSGGVTLKRGSTLLLSPLTTRFVDGTSFTFVTAGKEVVGEFTRIDIARNSAIDVHMIEIDYLENSIDLVIHSATHIKQALNLQAEMALKASQAQLNNFKAVNDRNLYSYDWCSKDDCIYDDPCDGYPCKNQGWDIYALTSYTAFDLKQTTNRRGGHIKASATTVGAEYVFDDYGSFGAGFGYTYGQVVHPAGFSTKTKSQAFTFGVNAIYAPIDFISFDFVGNIDKVWYDTKRMTTSFYLGQDATSNPQGLSANASLRIMPRICLFSTLFQPYFSSEYSWRHIQKFRENGPVDVSYESSKTSLSYWSAEGGGMISKTFKVNDLCFIPHINAAYVFKYNTPKIENSLITITDDAALLSATNEFDEFTTNYVKVGGGLDILNKDTFRVFLEANGFIKDEFNASFDTRFGFNVFF